MAWWIDGIGILNFFNRQSIEHGRFETRRQTKSLGGTWMTPWTFRVNVMLLDDSDSTSQRRASKLRWGTDLMRYSWERKRRCGGRVSMGESERDRERARRQPFKIQFPGSEEANPASVIPCSRSKPPSIHPSLPPSLPPHHHHFSSLSLTLPYLFIPPSLTFSLAVFRTVSLFLRLISRSLSPSLSPISHFLPLSFSLWVTVQCPDPHMLI